VKTSVPPIPPCPENIVDFSHGTQSVVQKTGRSEIKSADFSVGHSAQSNGISTPIIDPRALLIPSQVTLSSPKETPKVSPKNQLQPIEFAEALEGLSKSLNIKNKELSPLLSRLKSPKHHAIESDFTQDFNVDSESNNDSGGNVDKDTAFTRKSNLLIQLGSKLGSKERRDRDVEYKQERSKPTLTSNKRDYSRSCSHSRGWSSRRSKRRKLNSRKWNDDLYSDVSPSRRSGSRSSNSRSRSMSSRSRSRSSQTRPRSRTSSSSRSRCWSRHRSGQEVDPKFLRKDLKPEELDLSKYDNGGKKVFVGNIGFQATEHDLREVFEEFGNIENCYLTSNGNCGFVVFRDIESAIAAVRRCNERSVKLQGKKIRVLLAKARFCTTRNLSPQRYSRRQRACSRSLSISLHRIDVHGPSESMSDNNFDMGGRKIFVGRLPLSVEKKEFEEIFEPFGEIETCYLVKKPGSSTFRSMGVGFVIFKSAEDATEAVRVKDQSELYGKCIKVKLAQRPENIRNNTPTNSRYDKEGRKIHVKNIPFATLDRDLKEMFQEFGKIDEAYVPLTHDTERPQGYGFVTFKDARDAEAAIRHWNGKTHKGRTITCAKAKPPGRRRFNFRGRGRRW